MPSQTRTRRSRVAHHESKRILRSSPHYLRMSLNNPTQPTNTANDDASVSWNKAEEKEMISFLITHKAEAGDGFHFKDTTWSKVAERVRPLRTEGGVKTGKKCKEKWGRVRRDNPLLLIAPTDYYPAQKTLQCCHNLEDVVGVTLR
jgi:hypothetical protein